jgi:ketosteroid isomerase-like protein
MARNVALLLIGAGIMIGDPPALAGGSDQADVTAALEASAAAWSHGDLHGFMRVYENSPGTSYVTTKGVVTGYDAIEAMYGARFGGKSAGALGQLSLSVLSWRPLGPGFGLLTGRFLLHHPASHAPDATGLFTLVFHKSAGGWGIISDHTS